MKRLGTFRLAALLAVASALVLWQVLDGTQPSSERLATTVGYARVIDGDTIDIQGTRIRLHGIDAPEAAQLCTVDTRTYRCGDQATSALTNLLRGQVVRCEPTDRDRYQRVVARCRTEGTGIAINAWMVRHGHAVAYHHYSYAYVIDELVARAAGRGLWAGSFQMPWDYRAARRS